ncbi:triphosphoribosyl-dephospho-CoA synthase CitG [Lactiplantibacillus plajomi]|uniref:Probable 2-(5''-triphosphoribosyl)-3'-dephosphocoenzyme-A synthase n=1 Tax=Lactiplantibacillus plajomi TaxID=1457217 RepID=A0ABV6K5J6_9LACO|nr:triphosphoribosyl-dephospho-CoA synthase CitG [Lactiplantibacillus plajomi]
MTTIDIAGLARQSLLTEVALAPKPGLVDPFSNGAHDDMDYPLFLTSVSALTPYLHQYVALGQQATAVKPLFKALRQVGAEGERAMMRATDQVNTHKGANFSYAVLLGALGWCSQRQSLATLQQTNFAPVFETVQTMTRGFASQDFAKIKQKVHLSYGEQLYMKYGVLGVRGEAEAGYPALRQLALPFLARHQQLPESDRYLRLMVYLIANLEDGNLLHRGGREGLLRVQRVAQELLERQLADGDQLRAALVHFDHQLIDWHLSPGGTADLLALSVFFDHLQQLDLNLLRKVAF